MKKQANMILIGAAAVALAGCETVVIDTGGGNDGGGNVIERPVPIQKAQLPNSLRSADGDGIRVFGSGGGSDGQVRLCLATVGGMWKKEVAFGSVVLRSEGGTRDCVNTRANLKRLELRKAKFAGVITGVGNASLDLTGWGGGTVTIQWFRD